MKTDTKLQQATKIFKRINSGELDNRLKDHRQEVSNFLDLFPELESIDIYKYSVLLGFIHSTDVIL